MVAAKDDWLYLYSLDLTNFKAHEHLAIVAEGKSVQLLGSNRTGKTSTVDGLWWALEPLDIREMSDPIHAGAKKAISKVQLGDAEGNVLYTVTRQKTKSRNSLLIEAADGSPDKEGREAEGFVEGFLGRYTMDIGRFLSGRDQDQVDDVLAMLAVEIPVQEVQELTGELFEPLRGESAASYLLRLSEDKRGTFYNRRLDAGRVVEQKDKALKEQRVLVDRLGGPLKHNEGKRTITVLLNEIQAQQAKADQRRTLAADAEDKRHEAEVVFPEVLAGLKKERQRLDAEKAQVEAQIVALQKRLGEIGQQATLTDQHIEENTAYQARWAQQARDAQEALAAYPDPEPAILALRKQVATAEADNERLAQRRMASEQLDRLAAEKEQAEAAHRRCDEILAGLRHLRLHLLDGKELPVAGLQVGEGELQLNGVSFKTGASTSEQAIVACHVAMWSQPRLRLLRLDRAEMLDVDSTRAIHKLAVERGFRIISTVVHQRKPDERGMRIRILDDGDDPGDLDQLGFEQGAA